MPATGIILPCGSRLASDVLVRLGEEAEAAGYDWLFVNEGGNDALVIAAALTQRTSRATIATGVLNASLRHPFLTGAAAAQLDALSGGRFVLGLGTGHRAINEGVLGLPGDRPHARLIEQIAAVRAVAAGGRVEHEGAFLRASGIEIQHPAPSRPLRVHVGILVAGAARRLAPHVDGMILNFATPEHAAAVVAAAREAAAGAGRDPASIVVSSFVHAVVGSDRQVPGVERAAATLVAHYGRLAYYRRLYVELGFGREAAALEEAHGRGDAAAALAAVSDAMLEATMVTGDVAGHVTRLREAGVDVPVLYPYAVEAPWEDCLRSGIALGRELRV